MRRDKNADRLQRRLAGVGLVCLFSLILPGATPSQTQTRSEAGEDGEIHCRLASELMIIDVEVKDVYGWPVSNLSHDQFIVYENGKRQKIDFFTNKTESVQEEPPKYRLGYYPPRRPDADWEFRRIRVRVRNSKTEGLSVTCDPEGYFIGPRN